MKMDIKRTLRMRINSYGNIVPDWFTTSYNVAHRKLGYFIIEIFICAA